MIICEDTIELTTVSFSVKVKLSLELDALILLSIFSKAIYSTGDCVAEISHFTFELVIFTPMTSFKNIISLKN